MDLSAEFQGGVELDLNQDILHVCIPKVLLDGYNGTILRCEGRTSSE